MLSARFTRNIHEAEAKSEVLPKSCVDSCAKHMHMICILSHQNQRLLHEKLRCDRN